MINIKPGYCECGYEVWIEYIRQDGEWACRFLDMDHQEIERCPDCDRLLVEDELESW